jgi:hypothetical protein
VFLWLANWWDGVDLWLSQLAFPFQFAIVIAVLAPVCVGIAWAADRVVDLVSGRFTRVRTPQPAVVHTEPTQVVIHVRADVPAGTPATIIMSAIAPNRSEPSIRSAPADCPAPGPTPDLVPELLAQPQVQATAAAGRTVESGAS